MIRFTALAIPLLAGLAGLAACATEPKPAEAPPPPSAATSTSAPKAPAAEEGVSARVTEQAASLESAPYARLKVVFSNPTSKTCTFTAYTVRWGTDSKTFDLATFSVPPGETRERWGRVNPNDAGFKELEKTAAAQIGVEVKSDCPVKK